MILDIESAFLLFVLVPVVVLTTLISWPLRVYYHRRKLAKTVVVAQYMPPPDIKPAELGYLYDTRIRLNELVACILDLEKRGLVTITSQNGKNMISARPTELFLAAHEKFVLSNLHNQELSTAVLSTFLIEFGIKLRSDLVEKGYLQGNFIKAILNRMRTFTVAAYALFYVLILVALINSVDDVVTLVVLAVLMIPLLAMVLTMPLLLTGLISSAVSMYIIGHNWMRTKKLDEMWDEIEGYRVYIQRVEFDRIVFQNNADKKHAASEIQPYAVALGFDTKWKNRFTS